MNFRFAATAAFALITGIAHADLPAPTVSVDVGDAYDGYTQHLGGFGALGTTNGSSASAANMPGAAVEAIAQDSQSLAGAGINYEVEVDGPAGLAVPVVLDYRLFVKNLALGYVHNGSAEVSISGNGVYDYDHLYSANYTSDIYENCSNGCVTPGRLSATFTTNTAYTISIDASAVGAEAYADPILSIDTSGIGSTTARQLSLSFSDGITNALGNFTLGVPEPASWVFMIMGMFGLGAATRRRRAALA